MTNLRRPAGWKIDTEHWYVNERRVHGAYYKCVYCGWEVLGNGPNKREHAEECETRKKCLAETVEVTNG